MSDVMGFLAEAARYFRARPTGGEDAAHWSNVSNAENCERAAAEIATLRARIAELERELAGLREAIRIKGGNEHAPTQDAYDAACNALHAQRARAITAETALAERTAERDRMREALDNIAGGNFQGASSLAIDGLWQSFVDRLQAIARAALGDTTQPAGKTPAPRIDHDPDDEPRFHPDHIDDNLNVPDRVGGTDAD